MSKFYVDQNGYPFLVAGEGVGAPEGAVEVASFPLDTRQRWDGTTWLPVDGKLLALEAIAKLEETITPRRLRDAILTGEGAQWLSDVENEIAIERAKL